MPQLSTEQAALKASIRKSAANWGIILGIIAGAIAYWALSGQPGGIRYALSTAVGIAVLFGIRTWRTKANSAAATCAKCNATFSITRTGRDEKTLSSHPKETRDAQPDYSTKVTTWVEDVIETTDTYTCAKCGDTTQKQHTKTIKRDEVETIEPAPVKDKPAPSIAASSKGKSKGTTSTKR